MASAPLSLLTVHAHPDDEASKGPATVARYSAEGVRTVLVCCTGGEVGDIHNPTMDRPEVKENLGEVRAGELARAAAIIGYDEVVMLGYRDSGMAGSEANEDPRSFHKADLHEAVGRLVAIIRRTRPQVIVTYGDDQQGYPHPDHLKVHDVSLLAFEAAGEPDAHPGLGEPWQPLKMYYVAWSRARVMALHERFQRLGLESPYDKRWLERPSHDHRITTRVDVHDFHEVRVNALLAHATQVDPTSPFWFGLPDEEARHAYPYEDYVLARSLVPGVPAEHEREQRPESGVIAAYEDDLFSSVRSFSVSASG